MKVRLLSCNSSYGALLKKRPVNTSSGVSNTQQVGDHLHRSSGFRSGCVHPQGDPLARSCCRRANFGRNLSERGHASRLPAKGTLEPGRCSNICQGRGIRHQISLHKFLFTLPNAMSHGLFTEKNGFSDLGKPLLLVR